MNKINSQGNTEGRPLDAVLTPWPGTPTDRPITAVVPFTVMGPARFLSHAQLMRVFERACIRAGIPMAYSQGFNPHPRMSLPLPKSVGLAVRADVLCVTLVSLPPGNPQNATQGLAAALQHQLVKGIVLEPPVLVEGTVVLYPQRVAYRFPVTPTLDRKQTVQALMSRATCPIERRKAGRRAGPRTVDVRPYIEDVVVTTEGLTVLCKITSNGSIRIDELKNLLSVNDTDLQEPVTRTQVWWNARGQG